MTTRRAWALVAVAAAGLALTPWAGLASALCCACACGALCGLAALSARDSVREERIARMESALRDVALKLQDNDKRTAEMWRVYQSGV